MQRRTTIWTLALGIAMAPGADANAAGFDFSLLELEITGQNAFFDDFEDGQRFSGPTASLVNPAGSVTPESGGALVFDHSDGSRLITGELEVPFLNDAVRFTSVFWDTLGDYGILATLAPVTPTAANQNFFIDLESQQSSNAPTLFGIGWGDSQLGLSNPCGDGFNAWAYDSTSATYLGCDGIDPDALAGNILLHVLVDDSANEVAFLYSMDGGASFVRMSDFDVPIEAIQNYPPARTFGGGRSNVTLFLVAEGVVPELDAALLLLMTAGALVAFRKVPSPMENRWCDDDAV